MAKTDIGFSLGLNLADFKKSWSQAGDIATAQAKAMEKVLLKTAGVLAVAFGVGKFGGMIAGSIESGKAVNSLSRETGLAAEEILLMTHALDRSGQTAESTAGIMTGMRDKVREAAAGSAEARLMFQGMGLDIAKLQGMKPSEQFAKIAGEINSIKDPATRSAAAVALLGQNGAAAAANFNAGDIERASKLFGVSAKAMAEAAPGLARASDAFRRIQEGGKAFFDIIVSKLSPYIEKFAILIEGMIPKINEAAVAFGEKILPVVNVIYNAFAEGKLMNLIWLSLKAGFMKGLDFLTRGFIAASAALQEAVIQVLSMVVSGDFWSAIQKGIMALGDTLLLITMKAFLSPLKAVQDGMTFIFEQVGAFFTNDINEAAGIVGKTLNAMGLMSDEKFKKVQLATAPIKARDYETIQKEDNFSFFGSSIDELAQRAKDSAAQLPSAVDDLKNAWASAGNVQAIIEAATKSMAEGEGEGSKAATAELMKLVATLGVAIPKGEASLRPGEGKGKGMGALGSLNFFDSFRKVGGGLGGAALADIPKETLNVNKRMDEKLGRLIELTGGEARFGEGQSQGARFSFSSP